MMVTILAPGPLLLAGRWCVGLAFLPSFPTVQLSQLSLLGSPPVTEEERKGKKGRRGGEGFPADLLPTPEGKPLPTPVLQKRACAERGLQWWQAGRAGGGGE